MKYLALLLLLFASPAYALRDAVVLVHGATRGGAVLHLGPYFTRGYFDQVVPIFKKRGVDVFVPDLPMRVGREARVDALEKFIKGLGHRRVHIVAHSLGGIDSRFYLVRRKPGNVDSLTTIASPHFGTPQANYFARSLANKDWWYRAGLWLGYDLNNFGFLNECTLESAQDFNREILDRPDVKYFSVVADGDPWWKNTSPLLWFFSFFARYGVANLSAQADDGVVPVSSQPWGEVIDRIHLDHLGQLNYHWLRRDQSAEAEAMYNKIIDRLEELEREPAKRVTILK